MLAHFGLSVTTPVACVSRLGEFGALVVNTQRSDDSGRALNEEPRDDASETTASHDDSNDMAI